MDKRAAGIGAVIVVIIVIVGAYALYSGGNGNAYSTTTVSYSTVQSTAQTTAPQGNATLFNSTQYAAYSYLISGSANLSSYGAATSDFNLTSAAGKNSSTIYTIAFKDTGASYNVTLQAGQKLYYIDTIPTDDGPTDHTTGDDGYAVVNATGYVLSINYPISG